MLRFVVFSSAIATAVGCTAVPSTSRDESPLSGHWGGEHVALIFTDSGATLEYDCAHGGIAEPVHPAGGRFAVNGFHVREHGGPMREGEIPDTVPARYLGVARGDNLTLRVIVGPDTLGPFELRRGVEARVYKCL